MRRAAWLFFFAAAAAPAAPTLECPPQWRGFSPPESALAVCWNLRGETLDVQLRHPGKVWLALGFGKSMANADAVIGRPDTGEVLDVFIGGYGAQAIAADARQDVSNAAVFFKDGITAVKFSRALDTGDAEDYRIVVDGSPTPVIWAAGGAPGFDGHFARGAVNINWRGAAAFAWNGAVMWHAGLMLAAWLLMMPLGVILARYYKVTARQNFPEELDNQFWWHWHLALQYGGALLAAAALFIVWNAEKAMGGLHATAGIAAMWLAGIQIAGGLLRGSKGGPMADDGRPNPPEKIRGDHYDMTRRRLVFEFLHKKIGYVTLAVGGAAAVLGLRQTDAHWAAYAALIVWVGILAAWFFRLQKSGKWVGTYQAIWGADERHPGNRRLKDGGEKD